MKNTTKAGEKNFKKFNALPKNEKVVLVAKDILKQLDAKRYTPISAKYIGKGLTQKIKESLDSVPLHSVIADVKKCQVCQIGAVMLSCVTLGNNILVKDVGNSGLQYSNKIETLVKSIFSPSLLLTIEALFEVKIVYNITLYARYMLKIETAEPIIKRTRFFAAAHGLVQMSNEDRMRFICKHLIKHKGKFPLTVKTEKKGKGREV